MKIDIVTVFPEMFRGFLGESMIARAGRMGQALIRTVDLRDFARDQRRTVDDKPYAGGPGMLMKPEVWYEAVETCLAAVPEAALGAVRGILEGGGVHAVRPETATSIFYVINPLRVRHLKRRPKLPAHARIITNGLGGIFPRGLTVGFLVDEQDEGEMELEREGDVLPAVDFPSLENVFIRRED